MKIVIDKSNKLTRADSKNDKQITLSDAIEITKTPLDLFKKFGLDNIESDIKVVDTDTALAQYKELRDKVINDINLQKQINQSFLSTLKSANANFDDVLLQKITYKLDADENIDDVIKTIKTANTNALFRALEYDKESNEIISYSSREGIWQVNDNLVAKSIELRSVGSVRTDRALRSVREPSKFIDAKRTNYHLFEDTKALIESEVISNSYCTREQADNSYRDDSRVVYVTKLHFKEEELSEEDLKDLDVAKEVSKSIKEETTHVNKRQATTVQVEKSLEDNKKEIHTKHEPVEIVKNKDENSELKTEKEDALKSYVSNLLNDLEMRQKREREELTYKINSAMSEERQKAKQTFITSLSNGMTVTEAIDNLRSAKNNEIMIQAVLEEVKTDMILSVKKDEIISEKSKELEKALKNLESTSKKLEEIERKNKYNYEAYQKELELRKVANETISTITDRNNKLKEVLKSQKADIIDLKEDIKERDREIESKDKELDEQFDTIEKLTQDVAIKDENINTLNATIQNKDIALAKANASLEAKNREIENLKKQLLNKDETIKSLNANIQSKDIELTKANASLEAKSNELKNIQVLDFEKDNLIKKLNETIQNKDIEFAKLEERLSTVEKFNEKLETLMSNDFSKKMTLLSNENQQLRDELDKLKEAKTVEKTVEMKEVKSEKTEKKSNLDELMSRLDDSMSSMNSDKNDKKEDVKKNKDMSVDELNDLMMQEFNQSNDIDFEE